MTLAAGFSAFAIFLGIASIGFILLMASFVFGEVFGHADLGGHDADLHGDLHGGVSFLSTRVLSVFVTAFGGFGAVGIHLSQGIGVSTAIGLAGGFFFGGIIYLFANFLASQQGSSHVRVQELVGATAEVSVGIPAGGIGQIRCNVRGNVIEKLARAADGNEIPTNSVVKVEQIVGETVLVRRAP